MQTWYSPSTSKYQKAALLSLWLAGCSTSNHTQNMNQSTIAYPFIDTARPIARDKKRDKLVIRSAVGQTEYSIEIPGSAEDYDVQIPLAALPQETELQAGTRKGLGNPVSTDREMLGDLPSLSKLHPDEVAVLDKAFGVGEPEGPTQSPSYVMGIARANQYFKERNYEYALVEINNLLAFFPNSPRLLKMKGTLLIKSQNLILAERSWARALELNPQDKSLQRGLARLRKRLEMLTPKAQYDFDPAAATSSLTVPDAAAVTPSLPPPTLMTAPVAAPTVVSPSAPPREAAINFAMPTAPREAGMSRAPAPSNNMVLPANAATNTAPSAVSQQGSAPKSQGGAPKSTQGAVPKSQGSIPKSQGTPAATQAQLAAPTGNTEMLGAPPPPPNPGLDNVIR